MVGDRTNRHSAACAIVASVLVMTIGMAVGVALRGWRARG